MSKLIPLEKIQDEVEAWPYTPWSTGRLVRQGRLGCVRVGKRVFVTRELLEDFISRHTVVAAGGGR
jgi:hypothetical protein